MGLFLDILGYGFVFVVLAILFYIIVKLLGSALTALTKNDD